MDDVAPVVVRKMRPLLCPALGRSCLCLRSDDLRRDWMMLLLLLLLLLLQLLQPVVDLQIRLWNRQKMRQQQ